MGSNSSCHGQPDRAGDNYASIERQYRNLAVETFDTEEKGHILRIQWSYSLAVDGKVSAARGRDQDGPRERYLDRCGQTRS